MLANSGMKHLAPFAQQAVDGNYVKPNKRIFDNAKVSDHFAIIPTLQAPSGLSEAEQKLYDFVVRRFMSVFFPSAEYQVTTRISTVEQGGRKYPFRTDGKVLVKPGWLAIYGKEAQDDEKEDDKDGKRLVPVKPGEIVKAESVDTKGLKTRPPARYSEATLLGAMEGAGKTIDDDELREAMQEKGLGTPATPGVSSKVWRMACTSCSSTARSIRSCMASQPNSQPILPTMKPTISAAIGSRMG